MELVSFAPHPDYVNAFAKDPMARPARVEIDARGETFAAERSYPRGTPTTDPAYAMTTADLVEKFRRNATDVLADSQTEALVQGILGLEAVHSVHDLLRNAAQCRET
jgi:hypothetical protein